MKLLTEEQAERLEKIIKSFIRYYDTTIDQENGEENPLPAERVFKEFKDYHEWSTAVQNGSARDCTVYSDSCICGGRYGEVDRICDNCGATRSYIEDMLST